MTLSLQERIEAAIVKQLREWLPSNFYIRAFPADPKQFDPSQIRSAALVHYAGSKYGKGADNHPAKQARELNFVVLLYLYDLRGASGSYAAIEAVRAGLQNFACEGATPFMMAADRLTEAEHGQWNWQIDLTCQALAVASRLVPKPVLTNP